MATFPVPEEIVLALVLLPGYVVVRVGLYFARYAGPLDWSEYEKTALSLVGSAVLLAGVSAAFPRVVAIRGQDGGLAIVTGVAVEGYVAILLVAVVVGAVLGHGLVALYTRAYGITRLRVDPRMYLLHRLDSPVSARIVTDEREVVGTVVYTDDEGSPAVLRGPRLVTSRDGAEFREKVGRYAYIDPETIERAYFGSEFKPERGGFLARLRSYVRSGLGPGRGRPTGPDERSGPPVSVSEDPLVRDADRVRVRGTVRNLLDREIRFLQVKVAFRDADGTILGTGVDSFERLGGGDAWRFDVTYETNDPGEVDSFAVGKYAAPSI